MSFRLLLAALTLSLGSTAAFEAAAQTPSAPAPPPIEAYGALPALEMTALSPGGDRLARVTVTGEERMMMVSRLDTGEILAAARVGETKVRDLEWIDDERILITVTKTDSIPVFGVPRSEFAFGLTFDVAKRSTRRVFEATPGIAPMLMSTPEIRDTPQGAAVFVRAVSVVGTPRVSLYRIVPATGYGHLAHEMPYEIDGYVLDADGSVLAKSNYDDNGKRWSLVLRQGSGFRTAWMTESALDIPSLMGLGTRPGTVLVNAARPDLEPEGTPPGLLVYEVDVATGEWTRPPFQAEPDRLIFHPSSHLLIGAIHNGDEGAVYEFLDTAAAARWAAIRRAFPGKSPALASWSDDLRQVIVHTGGEGSTGVYQLVDFARGRADIVGETYPGVAPDQVGAVEAIEYPAADGTMIHGYLTLPPGVADPKGLPLVALPHGGPASHDNGGFDWWAQALASRGYAVLQPNFRGSTGYGAAFTEAGYGEWGRKMQTDVSDGVRWLAERGTIDPKRVCIVGASYGGYAALAGVTVEQGVYRCAVSVAGVSDLRRMVVGVSRRGRRDSEAVRYWNRFMGAERLGDRSLDERSPAKLAARADAPILLIHGRDDTVVPIEQSRVMSDALKDAGKHHRLVELLGEDHWLSRAETRIRMLQETVRFLELHNPTD
ncbi:MAG: alpha/beta hydrolase family protein [Brevundimonas sp.]|uniref:alpha/beta hydrolase family protein n=1 Tax=Brevundimonas sp. TaxID=1871086 RepID=UPI004034A425